jgi:hypothetical protein
LLVDRSGVTAINSFSTRTLEWREISAFGLMGRTMVAILVTGERVPLMGASGTPISRMSRVTSALELLESARPAS